MRVSNNQILGSGVQAMQQQAADALKYQKQIGSGNRFFKASEGAVELARGVAIQFEKSRYEMLKDNQNIVALRMGAAYTTLDTMASMLFDLKEMASRAEFPGMDATSREALYQEALAVGQAFKAVAQSSDSSGRQYLLDETKENIDSLEIEPGLFVSEAISSSEAVGDAIAGNGDLTGNPSPLVYPSYAGLRKQIANVDFFVESIRKLAQPDTPAGTHALNETIDKVLAMRARAGTIAAQVDIARSSLEAKGIELDGARARLLETDIAEASTKLVRAQTLLQAAQSIFSRLESSNLFQRLG